MELLTVRDAYYLEKKIEAGQMSKDDILELLEYCTNITGKIIDAQRRLERAKQIIEQQIKDLEI